MKRFLLCSLIGILSISVKAQTNTWIGGASGQWSTNGNWSLGHDPTSTEDVVISTTCNINMNSFVAGVRAIKSLRITGSVTVRLSCSVNGTRSLRISGTSAITKGLQIDADNTLIFDATNAVGTGDWICELTGGAGVTAAIDGSLRFEGNGSGTGGARLDIYTSGTNNANLVVSSTGRIILLPNTGDTDSGDGSYLTMQTGSVFEQHDDGGAVPAGAWDAGSIVKVITTGANPPVFNGTNYGNVEINCTSLASPLAFNKNISFNDLNLISTGSNSVGVRNGAGTIPYTLTINGNLTVSSLSIMELSTNASYGDSSGSIKVKGNIINDGMIRGNGGTSGSGNRLWFNGTVSQTIAGSGTWIGNNLYLLMNNSAGVTLLSPLLLKGRLVFNVGNIRTDATNILTFAKGDTYSSGWLGASPASFVDGPMRNVSTGTWITFPIGKGNKYAPIGYYHILNHLLTDTFSAEYFRANPQAVYANNYDATGNPEVIHHISNVEYWSLTNSPGGFVSNSIEPHVTLNSYCQDISNTFTARFDPVTSKWKNAGTAYRTVYSAGPPYATGYLQSNYVAGGIFTLATSSATNILGDLQAPLPIHLLAFDAIKLTSSTSWITWEAAEFSSAAEKFEVQRAGNDKRFVTIGVVSGDEMNRLYNYTDNDLKTGVNFYRLKMIDKDRRINYSQAVAVMNNADGFLLTSLIPTVVTDKAILTVSSSKRQKLDIVITDIQGRVMLRRNFTIAAGNTNIELQLAALSAGVYHLTGLSAEGKSNTIRFIK